MGNKKHRGSELRDFLKEQGLLGEVEARAREVATPFDESLLSSLSVARAEWEAATIPHPLNCKRSDGEIIEEPFRRYGDAIAWLEWDHYCQITKIETLRPMSGAPTSLLIFLKGIADRCRIHLYGFPVPYPPTCPLASSSPLSQEQLITWYSKCGFLVGKDRKGAPYVWYPDVPEEG